MLVINILLNRFAIFRCVINLIRGSIDQIMLKMQSHFELKKAIPITHI